MTPATPRRAWMAAAVVALSLLVHAKGIGAPLLDYHYHRQVNTVSIARDYYRENRPLWRPRIDWVGPEDRLASTEFPVEMWLHGKLWPLFGLGEAWGRVLSVLASALTALMLFLLFEREFGTQAAFFGAALFTVLPIEIYFGRTVQPEAAALLGFVSALYFWDRSLEPGRPLGPWLAATAAAFLAIGMKLPYAHLMIPLAGLAWRRLGRAALTDARLWAAGLLAGGGVIAWYFYASHGVYVVPTHPGEFWGILRYDRIPFYVKFLILSRFPEIIATYSGLVFFFFGAREVFVVRRDVFWLTWFFGSFIHLVALGDYGHIHEYSCLPLAASTAGLMGLGLQMLLERTRALPSPRKAWAAAGLALLVAAVPVHAALRIGHWYKQGFEYLGRAGEAANSVSRPNDLFFTNSVGPSVLLYYLDRRGWSEDLPLRTTSDAEALIDERARDGARFIASEKKGLFAEDGAMWKVLRARSKPVWDDGALVIFPLTEGTAPKEPSASRP